MNLADLTEQVPECMLAAWVDSRTGAVLERRDAPGAPLATADAEHVLDTVIEIVRSPQRPAHTVLLARDRVYLTRRALRDERRVLVVACGRSPNLGLAVALVRAAAEAAPSKGAA